MLFTSAKINTTYDNKMTKVCHFTLCALSLFTDPTTGTFSQFTSETFLNQFMQAIFQGFKTNMFDYIRCKGYTKQHPCFIAGNTSALHLKECVLVQLTGTHTM